MSEPTIVTGQFVRIRQTPASAGERLIALCIDYLAIGIYILLFVYLFDQVPLPGSHSKQAAAFAFILLPVLFYSFLCETFNRGQSIGKQLLHLRVVKTDGSTPSIGAYFLRWLLFPLDGPATGGLGIIPVLFTKNHQRFGDLAAGTMVIKENDYRKIHVSLDEFEYIDKNYRPVFPQSANLSLEQIDIIERTLALKGKKREQQIAHLTQKVRQRLSIASPPTDGETFLKTIVQDYRFYALEEL